MAITRADWREIQRWVEKRLADQGEYFKQGIVIKSDTVNKLVWLKEFGDTAIPLFTFDYRVKYYIVDENGNTIPKVTQSYSKDVEILTPQVGDIVLIAMMMGSTTLPRCVGVLKSTNITGGD